MIKKGLAVAVILLFIGTSIVPSISTAIEDKSCIATINDGNLSGYVHDTNMNPIEEVLVRVYFHGEYEEDYTDSSGFYHVTNIPICYCLKNATASKVGYETEWILLSIAENTAHDFVLTSLEPVPDLDCDGDLDWTDVEPGAIVTDSFTVENVGDPDSLLDWEIESYPDWGTWTFTLDNGTGLKPEYGAVTIDVEVVLPDEIEDDLWGEVKIVNLDNPDDYCIINVWIPHSIDDVIPIEFELQRIRDLVQNIDLRKIIVNPDAVVDTLEEILTILEEEDVRNYIEESSEEDCGCEEDSSDLEWFFPMICTLLLPAWSVAFLIFLVSNRMIDLPVIIMDQIGTELNCYWLGGSPWSK